MPRAVLYTRVSTADQAESGAGLKAQEDACRAHAARIDWEVVGPFSDEGISGAAPLEDRPGLVDALAQIRTGDILLIAKRDRLGRDPVVIAMLEVAVTRAGGRIVSAAGQGTESDEPESILMRRIVDAFGEFERLVIRARTRSALAAKQRRGERTGSVPFGFDLVDDGRRSKEGGPVALVANPAEQLTIATIGELHASGLPLRKIAAELERRGIVPKRGGPKWSTGSLARIVQRLPKPTGDTASHAAETDQEPRVVDSTHLAPSDQLLPPDPPREG